jgi:hypothetical protein
MESIWSIQKLAYPAATQSTTYPMQFIFITHRYPAEGDAFLIPLSYKLPSQAECAEHVPVMVCIGGHDGSRIDCDGCLWHLLTGSTLEKPTPKASDNSTATVRGDRYRKRYNAVYFTAGSPVKSPVGSQLRSSMETKIVTGRDELVHKRKSDDTSSARFRRGDDSSDLWRDKFVFLRWWCDNFAFLKRLSCPERVVELKRHDMASEKSAQKMGRPPSRCQYTVFGLDIRVVELTYRLLNTSCQRHKASERSLGTRRKSPI